MSGLIAIASETSLSLGGITALSSTDYPDNLAALLFCQGCPWRCRYCHNPHLQERRSGQIEFAQVLSFLKKRRGLLDAVVFSGGEATYQEGILEAVKTVKELGFKIGLHTAAPSLAILEKLIPDLNWIGLDIKSLPEHYDALTGIAGSGKAPYLAAEMLVDYGASFEARSTVHPLLHDKKTIAEICSKLAQIGVKNYALQIFRKTGCQDKQLIENAASFDLAELAEFGRIFPRFTLRN